MDRAFFHPPLENWNARITPSKIRPPFPPKFRSSNLSPLASRRFLFESSQDFSKYFGTMNNGNFVYPEGGEMIWGTG